MINSLNDEIRALDAEADSSRAEDPIAARRKAMDLLARREHAVEELVGKLVKSGFDDATARVAVARLGTEGLQDDGRYVESLVQTRIRQGKGPERIRAELRQQGIAADVVAEALDTAGVDWFAIARDVRLRKFGAAVPSDFKDKARQMRFLHYRGFDSAQVQGAFRLARSESPDK
jgi:regulatory protein